MSMYRENSTKVTNCLKRILCKRVLEKNSEQLYCMKNKTKSGSSTIDAIKMAEGFTFKIVFDCLIQMSNVQLT